MEVEAELGPQVFPLTPSAGTGGGVRQVAGVARGQGGVSRGLTGDSPEAGEGGGARVPGGLGQDRDVMPEV